ncbi:MAG: cytochrome c3 family protein [Deltaproteobacteria bacterium]|jgi:hypothetical protein
MRALVFLLLFLPSVASAQALTVKCTGQTYEAIAQERYGDARLGKILAIFNRTPDQANCKNGRFVRIVRTVRHEVRLGQTLAAIVSRFYRAPGAEAFLRAKLKYPEGTEPPTGTVLPLPVEIAVPVGARPARDLSTIYGLPSLDTIRRFNGLRARDALPRGSVYVPVELEPTMAPPPPPPPPPVASAPPPTIETKKVAPKDGPRAVPNPFPARFDRFEHAKHAAVTELVGCAGCHVSDPAEPTTYLPIDTKTCERCHVSFEATPPMQRTARLALTFSHDTHLAKGGAAQEEYEIGCRRCHTSVFDGQTPGVAPGHAVCVKCHNESEVAPAVAEACSGCHAVTESSDRLMLARSLLAEHYAQGPRMTDIRFEHRAHLPDEPKPELEDVACGQCHESVTRSRDLSMVEPMRMADCLECHAGLEREMVASTERLDRCAVCHVVTRESTSPFLASQLDRALAHSPTFRRRHARAAEADDGDCATCHVEMSGGVGADCQRCHERTRPKDHTVRWREEPHGRAAVRDPERCSTCHQRDRCADCHNVPPRDHFPREFFRTRHGNAAQRGIRRCQTCHIPQVDCARCHDVLGT